MSVILFAGDVEAESFSIKSDILFLVAGRHQSDLVPVRMLIHKVSHKRRADAFALLFFLNSQTSDVILSGAFRLI